MWPNRRSVHFAHACHSSSLSSPFFRVLYVTYAKASEGDLRARYYSDKRASFPPDIERDPSKKYEYKI